jgi:hypothetical protein
LDRVPAARKQRTLLEKPFEGKETAHGPAW